jgi:hypothetical protein
MNHFIINGPAENAGVFSRFGAFPEMPVTIANNTAGKLYVGGLEWLDLVGDRGIQRLH